MTVLIYILLEGTIVLGLRLKLLTGLTVGELLFLTGDLGLNPSGEVLDIISCFLINEGIF